MFVTVKSLSLIIDNEIFYMNINMDMLEGKLDNPNNYSRGEILGVVSRQCNGLHAKIDELKRISTNKRLIAKYEAKAQEVIKRFSEV